MSRIVSYLPVLGIKSPEDLFILLILRQVPLLLFWRAFRMVWMVRKCLAFFSSFTENLIPTPHWLILYRDRICKKKKIHQNWITEGRFEFGVWILWEGLPQGCVFSTSFEHCTFKLAHFVMQSYSGHTALCQSIFLSARLFLMGIVFYHKMLVC